MTHHVELFACRHAGAVYAECFGCGWVSADFYSLDEAQHEAQEHRELTPDLEVAS